MDTRINLRLPAELSEALATIAWKRRSNRNQLIVEVLKAFTDRAPEARDAAA